MTKKEIKDRSHYWKQPVLFRFVANLFLFPDSEGQHREVVTLFGIS